MVWVAVVVLVGGGVALIVTPAAIAHYQAMLFGARAPRGCVIVEGLLLLLSAVALLLAHIAGVLHD